VPPPLFLVNDFPPFPPNTPQTTFQNNVFPPVWLCSFGTRLVPWPSYFPLGFNPFFTIFLRVFPRSFEGIPALQRTPPPPVFFFIFVSTFLEFLSTVHFVLPLSPTNRIIFFAPPASWNMTPTFPRTLNPGSSSLEFTKHIELPLLFPAHQWVRFSVGCLPFVPPVSEEC